MNKIQITAIAFLIALTSALGAVAAQEEWDHQEAIQEEEPEEWDLAEAQQEEEEIDEEEWDTQQANNTDDNWDIQDAEREEEIEPEEEPEPEEETEEEWDHEDAVQEEEPEVEEPEWDHEDAVQDAEPEEEIEPEPEEEIEPEEEVEPEEEPEPEEEIEPEVEEPAPVEPRTYTVPVAEHEMEFSVPEIVEAGETFTVEGNITGDDIDEGENVTLYIDEEEIGTTTVDENGTFEADLEIGDAGEYEITAEIENEQATETLEVIEETGIESISAPSTVEPEEEVEICAEIEGEDEQNLILMYDDEEIETASGTGEVCLETTAPEEIGSHTYTVMIEDREIEEEVTIDVQEEVEEEPDETPPPPEDEEDDRGMIQRIIDVILAPFRAIT